MFYSETVNLNKMCYNNIKEKDYIYTKGMIKMAKQGMKRPDETHSKKRNEVYPVPEIQGSAKHGHNKANPIIEGTGVHGFEVYHSTPHKQEKPIKSGIYPVIDTDLARDNAENDMTSADLQDL